MLLLAAMYTHAVELQHQVLHHPAFYRTLWQALRAPKQHPE
ncbi:MULTISPECIES: hypothetical protein [Micromonospora]|nr:MULTISPECIES: hypothetical protein [Micromonospora]